MAHDRNTTLTLNGLRGPRLLSFLMGAGMITASAMTINHFFKANYPATIFTGAFCDLNAFFNCDSSAFSSPAQVLSVPLGYFGLFIGALVVLGAVLPSASFERTNKTLALLNVAGVIGLLFYSVLVLGSLCLLCSGYYLFSILSFVLFWRYGIDGDRKNLLARWVRPSPKLLAIFAFAALAGAYGFARFHDAKKEAQRGTAVTIVRQFYELPKVAWPSFISPQWAVRSTERFEDAAVQVVEYADFLCPDCLYLARQMERLKTEFAGRLNLAFQFFPLDECNTTVAEKKSLHPGACELATIAAAVDPARFPEIHDEIWANFGSGRDPEWRSSLAAKYGVAAALTDPEPRELVRKSIETGAEYEKTSDQFAHGIRSTPTMIINNRMIIGTLPYEHLRAIFRALVEERESGARKFIENWVPPAKRKR